VEKKKKGSTTEGEGEGEKKLPSAKEVLFNFSQARGEEGKRLRLNDSGHQRNLSPLC